MTGESETRKHRRRYVFVDHQRSEAGKQIVSLP
jgi:hypothetical protein